MINYARDLILQRISSGLWDFGLQLFNYPSTFPVKFIDGDIFDSAILDMSATPATPEIPSLHSLGNSLTPLRNHISVIHVSLVFHLFPEDKQLELAQRLGALLSPLPGSVIFGRHVGLPVPGIHTRNASGLRVFSHSPDSWRTLWETKVFEKGSVKVDAKLVRSEPIRSLNEEPSEFYGNDTNEQVDLLIWSVKRL